LQLNNVDDDDDDDDNSNNNINGHTQYVLHFLCELSVTNVLFCKTYLIENEMGRLCSTYWGEVYSRFWWGNLRDRHR
jgi:hypothetical protein